MPDSAPGSLLLTDPEVTADLHTFLRRARQFADDGAVRLRAVGSVLTATVCAIAPGGLAGSSATILGMRAMPLAQSAELDVTVALSAMTDRLARMNPVATELPIPPMTLNEPWAGISPPRSDWQRNGTIPAASLRSSARTSIEAVSAQLPPDPAPALVSSVRRAVLAAPDATGEDLPAGAAWAAEILGFLAGDDGMTVFTNGRWVRLSSDRGHVLVKR